MTNEFPTPKLVGIRHASDFSLEQIAEWLEAGYDTVALFHHFTDYHARIHQLAEMLSVAVGNSDLGKVLGVDEELAIEFKRILQSAVYLFHSAFFRAGHYHECDKLEIDTKLRRVRG